MTAGVVLFGGISVWFQTQHSTETNAKSIESLKKEIDLEHQRIEQEIMTMVGSLKESHEKSVIYLNEEDDGVRSDMDKEDLELEKRISRLEEFMIEHLKENH